jgi:hypothetical protein
MAKIDGKIPPINSKNVNMGVFAWDNRKISPYLAQNGLHSENNRKISGYFTIPGYFITTRLLIEEAFLRILKFLQLQPNGMKKLAKKVFS